MSHEKQKIRVNILYNVWLAAMFVVPQGSIFGSLLFNIFLADLFLIHSDTDFGDDNKLYFSAKNVEGSSSSLK